jgi:putative MFS transporter
MLALWFRPRLPAFWHGIEPNIVVRDEQKGVGYGTGNIGKIIGAVGLAVIVGTSNFVKPEATLGAIVPALLYLAFWYGQAGVAFWLLGFETKGRSIEDIDAALAKPTVIGRAAAAGSASVV